MNVGAFEYYVILLQLENCANVSCISVVSSSTNNLM